MGILSWIFNKALVIISNNPCFVLATYYDVNSLRPRQNGRHFADGTFKLFFQNENVWISIKISLKFVPKAPINNIPSLVQIMAWCRPGDKPLSEPMMVSLLTHICVTRPQWVKPARIILKSCITDNMYKTFFQRLCPILKQQIVDWFHKVLLEYQACIWTPC